MEIKVGQFARVVTIRQTYLLKITYVNKDSIISNGFSYLKEYIKGKTVDNLEDLIEVGDIVHFINFKNNETISQEIIRDLRDLEQLKTYIEKDILKIVGLELYENRVKQNINYGVNEKC